LGVISDERTGTDLYKLVMDKISSGWFASGVGQLAVRNMQEHAPALQSFIILQAMLEWLFQFLYIFLHQYGHNEDARFYLSNTARASIDFYRLAMLRHRCPVQRHI